MFKLRLTSACVNSSITACYCKVSILQQMEMKLPYTPESDSALNLTFDIDMTLEEIEQVGLKGDFRNSSTISESVPMRSPEDVERIAVSLSKMVTEWDSFIGGNWRGKIPFSPENVNNLLRLMGKPVLSAA